MRGKYHERKNANRKISIYISIIVLLVILIIATIVIYQVSSSNEKSDISENASVDYKVYLNENEFYEEEYLREDQQYVSSLIKNIVANFNYDLKLEDSSYDYTYRIDATLSIIDSKNSNSLYESTKTLVEEKTLNSNGKKVNINEEITVDYSSYDDIANNFIDTYDISNSESTLEVTLYVLSDDDNESTITLSIPLASTTISINTDANLFSESAEENLTTGNANIARYLVFLIIAILIAGIIIIGCLLYKYIIKSMDEETKYKYKKKRILSAYGGVIDKIEGDYVLNFEEYCTIKLRKFADLLKIKEDVSQPILMLENKDDTSTVFFIPNSTRFMYIFVLGKETKMLAEQNKIVEDKELSGIGSNNKSGE